MSSKEITQHKRRRSHISKERMTIGQYLIRQLEERHIGHIFGSEQPPLIPLIKLIDYESRAAFLKGESLLTGKMALSYGRVKGMAAIVGTLDGSLIDNVLCAYEENIPLVVILGCSFEAPIHEDARAQLTSVYEKVFRHLNACWTLIDNSNNAAKNIDKTLDAATYYQKPVCIELPEEMVNEYIPPHITKKTVFAPSDPEVLYDAIQHTKRLLKQAKNPVILVGIDCISYEIVAFAEQYTIPFMASIRTNHAVPHTHPLFIGVYPSKETQEYLKHTDCIVSFGQEPFTDKENHHTVIVSYNHLLIDTTLYPHVVFYDFIASLKKLAIEPVFHEISNPLIHRKLPASEEAVLVIEQALGSVNTSARILMVSSGYAVAQAISAQLATEERVLALLKKETFIKQCMDLALCQKYGADLMFIVFDDGSDTVDVTSIYDAFDGQRKHARSQSALHKLITNTAQGTFSIIEAGFGFNDQIFELM